MKLSPALAAAVLGALTLLTPTLASTVDDDLAVTEAHLEPRGSSACGAGAHHRKHHHRKGKKKAAKAKLQAKVDSMSNSRLKKTQGRVSSARPSHYYHNAQQNSAESRPKSFSSPNTTVNASTGSSGSNTNNSGTTSSGSTGATAPTTTTNNNTSSSSSDNSSSLSLFDKTMLHIHNADRAKHDASPLTWSPALASAAAKWAAGCKWEHTPNNPYGQNIAAGTDPNFGAKDSADMWYNEYKLYNFASGLYSDATGHFTQMVWKASRQLGCAIQECIAEQMGLGNGGGSKFVVCNYDPPGNLIGHLLQNVLSS